MQTHLHIERRRLALPAGIGLALVLNLMWVNASEVARYFLLVMPMMREALPQLPGVAPMSIPIFAAWGVWDSIVILAITGATWLVLERFGSSIAAAIAAATAVWLAIFVVFWLAVVNMGLAPITIAVVALPLAWFEMLVAAMIVRWCIRRQQ
jgi:hypothetical protein